MKVEQLEILDLFQEIIDRNLHIKWLALRKFDSVIERLCYLCTSDEHKPLLKKYLQIIEQQLDSFLNPNYLLSGVWIDASFEVNQADELRLVSKLPLAQTTGGMHQLEIQNVKSAYPSGAQSFTLSFTFFDEMIKEQYFTFDTLDIFQAVSYEENIARQQKIFEEVRSENR